MFPGRYRPSKQDFDRLWEEAIFVLDASVLLNLYRYSDDTREQMVAVLEGLEARLWLPYQVAREFLTGRLSVIHGKRRAYEELREYLEATRNDTEQQTNRLHRDPITESEDLLKRVQESLEELIERLIVRESELPKESNSPDEDHIWRTVDELYTGKVGSPYPEDRMKEILDEGKKRYEARIPPGYKDEGKTREGNQGEVEEERAFGDLLVWMQMLDEAESMKKPIVFVTDDRKEDWWWISHGKTIGPRPELVEEIKDRTGVSFHIYRPDRFMAEAGERGVLDGEVSEEAIGEAEELLPLEEEAQFEDAEVEPASVEDSPAPVSQTRSSYPSAKIGGELHPVGGELTPIGSSISPVARQALQDLSSPIIQDAIRNLSGPIAQDAIRSLSNPIAQDAIRKLTNPVTQEAMRKLANPATQEAMRKLASPEVQEYLRRSGPFLKG